MTNQEKLQRIIDKMGNDEYKNLLQEIGPGPVWFPKTLGAAKRKTRDTAIRADYIDKCSDMTDQEAYRMLAKLYGLSPDRVRKIVKCTNRSR